MSPAGLMPFATVGRVAGDASETTRHVECPVLAVLHHESVLALRAVDVAADDRAAGVDPVHGGL